jgi:pyruvate-formate lyase-activating enzyme
MDLKVDRENTMVLDITYLCNATCRYCRWGSPTTAGRNHQELKSLLLPAENVRSLGTKRVVLSGGEPRLHPDIEKILSYYSELVDDVVVITNGYGLDGAEVIRLVNAGATGITVSLDSVLPEVVILTRATPKALHMEVMNGLERIASLPRDFELGINSVVSHPTANWRNAEALLAFGHRLDVDFVKFQPIFDDGFAGSNATDLLLSDADAFSLAEVALLLPTTEHPPTNPVGFWLDLVAMTGGEALEQSACGLGPRQSIVTKDSFAICYWLASSSYGDRSAPLQKERVNEVREGFESKKLDCRVDFHCFCTQNVSHEWKRRE